MKVVIELFNNQNIKITRLLDNAYPFGCIYDGQPKTKSLFKIDKTSSKFAANDKLEI
jgi:hypothetical protein